MLLYYWFNDNKDVWVYNYYLGVAVFCYKGKVLFMVKYEAELFDNNRYSLGESPYYDPRFERFSWVDIINGRLWMRDKEGNKRSFDLGQPIGAAVPLKRSDGFLLAAMDGLYIYEDGKAEKYLDLNGTYKPYWRSNDAKADPSGRLWFGASVADDDHAPEGNLYCYSDGAVKIMQANTRISNGMAWSRDGKKIYFDSVYEGHRGLYYTDVNVGITAFDEENGTNPVNTASEKIRIIYLMTSCVKLGPTSQTLNIIKNLDRTVFEPILITLYEEADESLLKDFLPCVSADSFVWNCQSS